MLIIKNPHRNIGLPNFNDGSLDGHIKTDSQKVIALLKHCPVYKQTPLVETQDLAQYLGVAKLYCKDERNRMQLGSFKALGAAYVVAERAYQKLGEAVFDPQKASAALNGEVFVTASAGNHGLSLAGAARVFGGRAIIYLSHQVPQDFAKRLRDKQAEVIIAGNTYEESLQAAIEGCKAVGGELVSDSTWDGYDGGIEVMHGYTVMATEIVEQLASHSKPSDVFLQAGVGGLAAAMTASLRHAWGNDFAIHIVEPTAAPAIQDSILAKDFATAKPQDETLHSCMGRLDCKQPSLRALQNLAYNADSFITISDSQCQQAIKLLASEGLECSASGGAGFAALAMAEVRQALNLSKQTQALCILSEA